MDTSDADIQPKSTALEAQAPEKHPTEFARAESTPQVPPQAPPTSGAASESSSQRNLSLSTIANLSQIIGVVIALIALLIACIGLYPSFASFLFSKPQPVVVVVTPPIEKPDSQSLGLPAPPTGMGSQSAIQVTTVPSSQKSEPQPALVFAAWNPFLEAAFIAEVQSGTAAEQAGLHKGDVIAAIDKQLLMPGHDFQTELQKHKIGDQIRLTVQRGGKELTLQATLGSRVDEKGQKVPFLGIQYTAYQPKSSYAVDLDGTALFRFKEAWPGGEWSPDNSALAFTDGGALKVASVATGNVNNLTDDSSQNLSPAWSPDGRQLAFISNRGGKDFEVYLTDIDGKETQKLTSLALTMQSHPTWSPDSHKIALNCPAKSGKALSGICIIDIASGQMQAWTVEEGSAISYPGQPPDEDLLGESWLRPGTLGAVLEPKWSPTGESIAFVGLVGNYMHAYLFNPGTHKVQQLTGQLRWIQEIEWSPDGNRIAMLGQETGTGTTRLYVMKRDASDFKAMIPLKGIDATHWVHYDLHWLSGAPAKSVISDVLAMESSSGGTGTRPSVGYDADAAKVSLDFRDSTNFQRGLSGADEPIVDIYGTILCGFEPGSNRVQSASPGQTEVTVNGARFTFHRSSSGSEASSGFNLKFRVLTRTGKVEDYWLAVDPPSTNVQVKTPLQVKIVNGAYQLSLR